MLSLNDYYEGGLLRGIHSEYFTGKGVFYYFIGIILYFNFI